MENSLKSEIRQELEQLAEPEYAAFSARLLPKGEQVLGVRLPILRQMAKKLAKQQGLCYLKETGTDTLEECMLQGMIIGYLAIPFAEKKPLIRAFLPRITNGSVCDSFCVTLKKDVLREKKTVWKFLQECLQEKGIYTRRFAYVMMLDHFVEDEYLEAVFAAIDADDSDEYYVQMAQAWAIATCFCYDPNRTFAYLRRCNLNRITYRVALQKMMDSKKVGEETKQRIRAMRDVKD